MIQQRRSSSTHIHSLSVTAIIHPNHKKKRLGIIHQIPLAGQFFRAFYAADLNLISHGQDLKNFHISRDSTCHNVCGPDLAARKNSRHASFMRYKK
jgi:hypothetical protein